jgi:prepilin-type N-terminal cleavage/methylation domain-containing protein
LAKSNFNSNGGFSLVETLVAVALLATAIASSAHLFAMATRSNLAAQRSTFAATLAAEKMEQLKGLAWGFDEIGLPINDYTSNTAVDPPTPNGGTGLSQSPSDALSANVDGYVDYLDRFGNSLGGGTNIPAGTLYVRRWSIEPLPTNPNNTLIFQVLVFNIGDREEGTGPVLDRVRDEARVVGVKTRKSR